MGGSAVWVGEPELPRDHSGHKLSPAADRRRAHWAVRRERGLRARVCVCVVFFPLIKVSFFFVDDQKTLVVEILPACFILSCRGVCLAAGGLFVVA